MKKLIALLLCIVLTLSLCIPASAGAYVYKGPEYKNYFCIGDSIPAGFDLHSGDPEIGYDKTKLQFIQGSYPALVRDAVGADGYYTFNGAHTGMRVAEALYALGVEDYIDVPGFTSELFNTNIYGGNGTLDLLRENRQKYIDAATNADLITINLASNDLAGSCLYTFVQLLEDMSKEEKYAEVADSLNKALDLSREIGISPDALYDLATVFTKLDLLDIPDMVARLSKTLLEASAKFKKTFSILLETIYQMNPDAVVLVLGMYNPIVGAGETFGGSEEQNQLIETVFDPVINSYNFEMQYLCKYRMRYTYVDMTELGDILNTLGTSDDLGVHPDEAGHQVIAKFILKTLENEVCTHANTHVLFQTKATRFGTGYSGDTYCKDCGCLLEKGTVQMSPDSVKLPILSGTGVAVVAALVRALIVSFNSTVYTFRQLFN